MRCIILFCFVWVFAVTATLAGEAVGQPTLEKKALASFISGISWEEHPSDDVLLRTFQEHKSRILKLLNMFQEDDALEVVGLDRTRPEDLAALGISKERIEHYRVLLNEIGIKQIYAYGSKNKGINMTVSSRGMATSGSSKSYYWKPTVPELIVEDLDKYRSLKSGLNAVPMRNDSSVGPYTAFRKIEDNWYISFSN